MSVQVEELPEVATSVRTMADLINELSDVETHRILLTPLPGNASATDVERYECELVDGTLVRKTMGFQESFLAVYLVELLNSHVRKNNLGIGTGPDGFYQLFEGNVRAPDVSFIAWSSLPGGKRPSVAIPLLAPDLCIEVLSPGNTKREMQRKRKDYFAAGVKLVWMIDPAKRTATVYDADDAGTLLAPTDSLDGGQVLPGFTLPLVELFGELDRVAPDATPAGRGS